MESKLKHLEFIQNVITRMNSNSFLLKGWSVTLVSALFALAAKDTNKGYVLISYCPIVVFWILDGFFLFQEKCYRELYSEVSAKDKDVIDFSMNASGYASSVGGWSGAILTKTLVPFHGILLAVNIIVMFVLW